ncbi:NUDIX hydrolase [Crenothrix sp.]|uniref:NUDIX hydrolase n=1 Tax=Crenothrix sp. TaxID=3100433 RepID=UPI00374D842F
MVWKPNVTVAAVIRQDDRFLFVEEETSSGLQFNQPAGHLEENEDLIAAVKREVNEETAWHFEPEAIISVQLWRQNPEATSFIRFCFAGSCHSHDASQKLDDGIVATHWLTHEEIIARQMRLRSPLVRLCVEEYLSGQRYPLTLLKSLLDINHA